MSLLLLDHIEGVLLMRRGHPGQASALYLTVESRYRDLGIGEPSIVPFGRHAATAHARTGRVDDANRVIAWLEKQSDGLPDRWPAAAAAAGRGAVATAKGDLTEADALYGRAAETLAASLLPLEHAEVLIEHGMLLRRIGRPREARESFRQAIERAESGGAVWLARRAREELAAAGGRMRSRRGPTELTPQEQRAARLAATGISDKEIAAQLNVSVRTVRSHLEHVFAKLGLHSRRELMAMADRLDPLVSPDPT